MGCMWFLSVFLIRFIINKWLTVIFVMNQHPLCSLFCSAPISYLSIKPVSLVALLPLGSSQFGTDFLFCCRATVHIQVNDMNEYSPVFKEKSYKATVIEGKAYDNILKVEAVDADCSFQFSQICSYEIVTPDVPFTIDKDGKMRATWDVLGQKNIQPIFRAQNCLEL